MLRSNVRTDDGATIAYRAVGSGPLCLLFLHGWAGSGRYWDEMIAYLDLSGLRLLLPDLRGHGDSDKPETGFTLERFARDMFAVADHAQAPQVVLVGYSMSGRFAQFMAVEQPERVLGQVLISPAPASELILPPEVQQAWVRCAGQREAFRELALPFFTKPVPPAALDQFLDDAVKVSAAVLDETLNMCQSSFAERLPALRTPTLVIGGVQDTLTTPELLREKVAQPIHRARLVLLECGHETPFEEPRATTALIEAFLAGLSSRH